MLSGLSDPVGYLAGTVSFDSTLLGGATNVASGDIVPDDTGFLGFGATGLADGNYDFDFASSGAPIVANGTFFSFDVTVQQAGSGSILLDPTFLAARDISNPAQEISIDAGDPLSFTSVGTQVVPEPPTSILFSAGLLAIVGLVGWRQSLSRWSATKDGPEYAAIAPA